MNFLTLMTDAHGGRGGIAKYNRDMHAAICAHPEVNEVTALPRVIVDAPDALPEKLNYRTESAGSRLRFMTTLIRVIRATRRSARDQSDHEDGQPPKRGRPFDGVICGHIHLLPLAYLAARWLDVPLLLVLYGIDAWQPTSRRLTDRLVTRADAYVSISEHTRQRFIRWTGVREQQVAIAPCCINTQDYAAGPKPDYLLDRYGLRGRTTLLTLARLSADEQYKGHDEVLEALPDLIKQVPDLKYLIAGDGDDRPRLEAKAAALGLRDRVVFTGYVPEAEKADHYRVADAFVMPGRGEGFGIVYLEAMACGIPVVASSADASREAVRDGALGQVVDPDDPDSIKQGILAALAQGRGTVPAGLDYFSEERFRERWHALIDDVFQTTPRARPKSAENSRRAGRPRHAAAK